MSLESYDFNNSKQSQLVDQAAEIVVNRNSRQNRSQLQNKNKINRLKKVGGDLIEQVAHHQNGINVH